MILDTRALEPGDVVVLGIEPNPGEHRRITAKYISSGPNRLFTIFALTEPLASGDYCSQNWTGFARKQAQDLGVDVSKMTCWLLDNDQEDETQLLHKGRS